MRRIFSLIVTLVFAGSAGFGPGPAAAQVSDPAIVITPGEGRAFRAAVQQFADRARFRGLEANIRNGCDTKALESYAPRSDCFFAGLMGKLPDALITQMEQSTARWVIGFKNAHELQLWPHPEDATDSDDVVQTWFQHRANEAQEHLGKLRKELISSLTKNAENPSRESV